MSENPSVRTFEDVVRGERAVHRIHEDQRCLAFLAPAPVAPGHTIVLPRRVEAQLFDLPPPEYHELWELCRVLAARLRARLPCERVCVAVVGWEVRHAHVHLIPTVRAGQFPPLTGVAAAETGLAALAARLRA